MVLISGIGGLGHMAVQYAKAIGHACRRSRHNSPTSSPLPRTSARSCCRRAGARRRQRGAEANRRPARRAGPAVSPKAMEQAYSMLRSKRYDGTGRSAARPDLLPVFDTVLKRITVRGSIGRHPPGSRGGIRICRRGQGRGRTSHGTRSRTSTPSSRGWKKAR